MPRPMTCRVLTPNGLVLEREAVSVRFPAHDGLMGILPGHAPLIATVGKGSLAVRGRDDLGWFVDLEGGFMEVRENVVTIVAERAGEVLERSEEAKRKVLEEARHELQEISAEPPGPGKPIGEGGEA